MIIFLIYYCINNLDKNIPIHLIIINNRILFYLHRYAILINFLFKTWGQNVFNKILTPLNHLNLNLLCLLIIKSYLPFSYFIN